MPRAVGRFARAHLQAQKLVEAYAGLTHMYIQQQFAMEDAEMSLEDLTLRQYLDELESADMNDTRAEFEQKLARMLAPILEQAFMEQPDA